MTRDLAWLELDDDPKPRKTKKALERRAEQKSLARTQKRIDLVALFRELDWDQRLWLKALVKNSFDARKARKDLKGRNLKAPAQYTSARWARTNVAFAKARELLADLVYEGSAPTKSMLLLRLDKIAEYNIEEVDEYHQGEPTGRQQMRDVGAALKATEMQGKHLKMFGEEKSNAPEGPQLVVQIISAADHSRVIDVTPGRVGVQPVRPDEVEDAEPADGNP